MLLCFFVVHFCIPKKCEGGSIDCCMPCAALSTSRADLISGRTSQELNVFDVRTGLILNIICLIF